jgi:hypothetical protein
MQSELAVSQNSFHSRALVDRLLDGSGIQPGDMVLDLGTALRPSSVNRCRPPPLYEAVSLTSTSGGRPPRSSGPLTRIPSSSKRIVNGSDWTSNVWLPTGISR